MERVMSVKHQTSLKVHPENLRKNFITESIKNGNSIYGDNGGGTTVEKSNVLILIPAYNEGLTICLAALKDTVGSYAGD